MQGGSGRAGPQLKPGPENFFPVRPKGPPAPALGIVRPRRIVVPAPPAIMKLLTHLLASSLTVLLALLTFVALLHFIGSVFALLAETLELTARAIVALALLLLLQASELLYWAGFGLWAMLLATTVLTALWLEGREPPGLLRRAAAEPPAPGFRRAARSPSRRGGP